MRILGLLVAVAVFAVAISIAIVVNWEEKAIAARNGTDGIEAENPSRCTGCPQYYTFDVSTYPVQCDEESGNNACANAVGYGKKCNDAKCDRLWPECGWAEAGRWDSCTGDYEANCTSVCNSQ
jgi:hypothetical protein